jgi:hypothetical protein
MWLEDQTKNGARTGRPDVTASDQAAYHRSSLNGDKAVVSRGVGGDDGVGTMGIIHKGAKGHAPRPSRGSASLPNSEDHALTPVLRCAI